MSMARVPQIFGIGGNFFVEPWQRPSLQQYLLRLAGVDEPRVCFIGTAGGDNPGDVEQFYRQMQRHRCRLTHLNLFAPHTSRFEDWFMQHDIIYVGGGATRNLVALWREWGLVAPLRAAWQSGVVLAGTSAGSICWFEGCITDSLPEQMLPLKCLGFLRGSACTHYSSRPDRPAEFRRYLLSGAIAGPGLASEDHVGLHYVGTSLQEVVTAVPGKQAYELEVRAGEIVERPLAARFLGGS
jgi:dipeptidase E